jgi:acetoacetate decarboxylase
MDTFTEPRPLYSRPPWRLTGRALSVLYRLRDPGQVFRHLPPGVEVDADPIVRVRMWDLLHNGDASRASDSAAAETPIREAAIAIPVHFGAQQADYLSVMYADEPVYVAFGREMMGWPLHHARVTITNPKDGVAVAGSKISASAILDQQSLVSVHATLTGATIAESSAAPLPRWISVKSVPRVDAPGEAMRELTLTGPSAFSRGGIHAAVAELHISSGSGLDWLHPREVVDAALWSDINVTIGYGQILADFGEAQRP